MIWVMRAAKSAVPGKRRDAQRNRQVLVHTASRVVRERGLDASLDEIARRAGVASATLYRHFPTREDLYEAVFAGTAESFRHAGDEALATPDDWSALNSYLEAVGTFMADNRGLCDLMDQEKPRSQTLQEVRRYSEEMVRTLLDRAQRQGSVRPDVTATDVLLILCGLQRVIPVTVGVAPHAWRRHLALAMDALRARCTSALPQPELAYEELVRVL
jgi:AcrR family transcriptional regulator